LQNAVAFLDLLQFRPMHMLVAVVCQNTLEKNDECEDSGQKTPRLSCGNHRGRCEGRFLTQFGQPVLMSVGAPGLSLIDMRDLLVKERMR